MRLEPLPSAEEGARLLGKLPTGDPPQPLHFEWRPSDTIIACDAPAHRCRYYTGSGREQCGLECVAVIYRGSQGRPWRYCEEHLYGRVISGGVVYDLIVREGP